MFAATPDVDKILEGLNGPQRQAVQATDGPLLVVAGAGSGKTNVLIRRIAWLIAAKRVAPWSILAITFTNKAAREMRDRLQRWIGPTADDIWAMTFHAMCARVLRRDIERLGYAPGFTVLDDGDQMATVRRVMADQNLDVKQFEPRAVLSAISAAKNVLRPAAKVRDAAVGPWERLIGDVYLEYERRLKRNNSLDFDDLLFRTVQLFEQEPDVLSFYHHKFHYLHVDEYQDTNHAQYRLVSLLAQHRRNLCVVGDSDQSIYGWRGADMQNILQFERDYPDAQVIRLEQNYRSTKTILAIANAVIQNNVERKDKTLWTELAEGELAVLFTGADERQEARFVVEQVGRLLKSGARRADIAVLYRTNAQSRVIEEAFLQVGLPYRVYGGLKFYDRKEIRDVMAYMRLIANPADDVSFLRVVNAPKRGIGDTTLDKLQAVAAERGLPLFEAVQWAGEAGVTGRAQKSLALFVELLGALRGMREYLTITELTEELLMRTGYREALVAERTLEAEARVENLDEFLSVTREFEVRWRPDDADVGRLESFLTEVALVSDTDLNGGKPVPGQDGSGETDQIVMMTLHSAKGLEFPNVFLTGLEEGIFPHARSQGSEKEIEEERRLCYVGITRAKQLLFLTTCSARTIYGQFRVSRPSRFLAEMPVERLARLDTAPTRTWGDGMSAVTPGWTRSQEASGTTERRGTLIVPKSFGADLSVSYDIGDIVEHRKWGEGTIHDKRGDGEDLELTIEFAPPIGRKSLLARFAPIVKQELAE